MEKITLRGTLWSVLLITYYSDDQIKKNQLGRACATYGGGERCCSVELVNIIYFTVFGNKVTGDWKRLLRDTELLTTYYSSDQQNEMGEHVVRMAEEDACRISVGNLRENTTWKTSA